MNDKTQLITREERHALQPLEYSKGEVVAHVRLVQEVMEAVMKEGVHYGKIPGTPKPSLWKPGAEVLGMTFRIAPSYQIEDLSTADAIRYRVRCVGTHQISGHILGEGAGECSSNEEKYKWRKAVNKTEWNATPEDRRRIKYARGQNGDYTIDQVRTSPADIANTILKMACKRAQVAMAINVTAASDIFAQDLEDLPEEIREGISEEQAAKPAAKTELPAYPSDQFAKNLPTWMKLIGEGKKTAEAIIATVSSKYTLSEEQRKAILATAKPATVETPAETVPEKSADVQAWQDEYSRGEAQS